MLKKLLQNKQNELANVVRILIYKESPEILTKVNLDDDDIFLEPLLFAYFNRDQISYLFPDTMLDELMQGFFINREIHIKSLYNHQNIAYLPNIGYFKKDKCTPFSSLYKILGTDIEVIPHEVLLLRNVVHIVSSQNPIKEGSLLMSNELFEENIKSLTNGVNFLKNNNNQYFSLIQLCLKKCIFFKIKNTIGKSFASIKANGIIYFNLYEDIHDEVYFIDNLGFLSGKIIFTTLLHAPENIFKFSHRTKIRDIINTEDSRNIYTLFSNLFSYSTAHQCLNSCANLDSLTNQQKNEIILRLALYKKKYELDFEKFESIIKQYSGIENIFFSDGILIFSYLQDNFINLIEYSLIKSSNFDYSNVNYKMTFIEFEKNNL